VTAHERVERTGIAAPCAQDELSEIRSHHVTTDEGRRALDARKPA
jgi:hypothetical protein